MITWITGQTKSGKSTLAHQLYYASGDYDHGPYDHLVWLDGDKLRKVWTDLGFSKKDRWEQNMRVARLALMFEDLGKNVVVSVICPYKKLREEIKKMTNCKFLYVEGGKEGKEYPFQRPKLY